MLLELLIKKVAHCLRHLEGEDLAVLSWGGLGTLVIYHMSAHLLEKKSRKVPQKKNILGKKLRFKPPQNVEFLVDERLQKHKL